MAGVPRTQGAVSRLQRVVAELWPAPQTATPRTRHALAMNASRTVSRRFLAHFSELLLCSRCLRHGIRTPVRQVISRAPPPARLVPRVRDPARVTSAPQASSAGKSAIRENVACAPAASSRSREIKPLKP